MIPETAPAFPCPFLFEKACSIYEVRPPACRSHMSISVDACKAGEFTKNAPDIPMPFYTTQFRTAVDQALWGVMFKRGLQYRGYELGEAVMRVLPDPAAEERWWSGEDVFTDVGVDKTGMGPMPMSTAEKIWNSLWDVANGRPPAKDSPFNHLLPKWCFD